MTSTRDIREALNSAGEMNDFWMWGIENHEPEERTFTLWTESHDDTHATHDMTYGIGITGKITTLSHVKAEPCGDHDLESQYEDRYGDSDY